jgi:hypothetical protein
MLGPGDALYVTSGSNAPAGKQALAAALLNGPLHRVTPPKATRPVSKVSTGSPGAALSNSVRLSNVMVAASAGTMLKRKSPPNTKCCTVRLTGIIDSIQPCSNGPGPATRRPIASGVDAGRMQIHYQNRTASRYNFLCARPQKIILRGGFSLHLCRTLDMEWTKVRAPACSSRSSRPRVAGGGTGLGLATVYGIVNT